MRKVKLLAVFGFVCIGLSALFSCNANPKNIVRDGNVELSRREILTQYAITGNYKLTESEVVESLEAFLTSRHSANGIMSKSTEKSYSFKKLDTVTYQFNKPSCCNSVCISKDISDEEKSDDVNLFLYEIKNECDSGYAILSDDLRIGYVLCIVDGEFDSDVSDNPFMQFFASSLDSYIEITAKIWEELNENDIEALKEKYGITDEDIEKARRQNESVVAKNPMFETRYSSWSKDSANERNFLRMSWNQRGFFNDAIESVYGKDYPTGCVTTALAQIFAFHKYPDKCEDSVLNVLKSKWSKINNWDGFYNWSSMCNNEYSSRVGTGVLMYQIAEGIDADYGVDGTGAWPQDAAKYARTVGYESDNETSYSFDKIKSSIDSGSPVLTSGYSKKTVKKFLFIPISTSYSGGHAWVIDGYTRYSRTKTDYVFWIPFSSTEYDDYVHCNLGWGGSCNGYYKSEIFNTKEGPVALPKSSSTSGTEYDYEYN